MYLEQERTPKRRTHCMQGKKKPEYHNIKEIAGYGPESPCKSLEKYQNKQQQKGAVNGAQNRVGRCSRAKTYNANKEMSAGVLLKLLTRETRTK